jgi:extradiol dioxygenase family protein
MKLEPFHYSFLVKDLATTRAFYVDILGCKEGRSTDHWVDFDFFGNQISAHVSSHAKTSSDTTTVDGISVPMPHFGCILSWDAFQELAGRVEASGISFIIAPTVRYKGQIGEQATMFFLDFSGNALEFKAFKHPEELFTS